jgi:NAD(P)H dehydrogenase (quinone)
VASLRDTARDALMADGWTVDVQDLYAEGFDPVARGSDFLRREAPAHLNYAREQRHAAQTGTLAPDITQSFERLMAADLLVLTFPLWWFSVPAMMKGWFDRVLLCGPVYGGRRFYSRGGMKGRRALIGVSLGGRETMFGPDAVHPDIETLLMPVLRGTLGYAGFDVLPPFVAWHVPYVDDAGRRRMLKGWHEHVGEAHRLPVLPMPDLSRFDDLMRPLSRQPDTASG